MSETKYKGMTIEILQEEHPCNPREDDNLSTFAFFHRNYANESDIDHKGITKDEMREFIESRNGLDAICVPVFLYSHSGDCLKACEGNPFYCEWDSGQLGFVFVPRKKAREWWGWKRITRERENRIIEALKGEVEIFNKYVNGEVYGYILKSEDERELDSCWGFYDEDQCLAEAKSLADYYAKEQAEVTTG